MFPIHRFRLIVVALISFLFVANGVFLRRTTSIFLCGVLGFNSASCYGFLGNYGKVDAAAPPSSAVVTSKDFSVVQKDKQKIAGCPFGVCVNLPKIPGIPGVPGGDILGTAKAAVIKQIGESLGVGSPLLLDQHTAYPDVSDQVKDFHPKQLTITSAEDLKKPLPPGDYSLSVTAYCTQFSIHAPGQGLPYKLARLQGKQAPAISALLARGTLQRIAPATLNADAWRIQAGLPLKQWPPQDQDLVHKLIPEYEKGLEGDYLQRIENTYNKYRAIPGMPSFNDLLRQVGPPGQLVLQLRQARQVLSDKTISAERLPEMLYEPTGDGLPRVLPAEKNSSPSHWAEVKPGVFARFTVIEGNLGRNLFEFRITPKASAAINDSAVFATKDSHKNFQASDTTDQAVVTLAKIFDYGADGVLYIGYAIVRAAQALISFVQPTSCPANHAPRIAYRAISPKGPYKLTIYIDDAMSGDWATPGGHAWISLSDGQTTNYYGFYPTVSSPVELPYVFLPVLPIGAPGILKDDHGRNYSVFKEYIIDEQGLRNAYQAIVDWNDNYNLAFHNCASFASSIGIASGALSSQDIGFLTIINPGSLANYLLSHGGKLRAPSQ